MDELIFAEASQAKGVLVRLQCCGRCHTGILLDHVHHLARCVYGLVQVQGVKVILQVVLWRCQAQGVKTAIR